MVVLYTIIQESIGEETQPNVNTRAQTSSRHDREHFDELQSMQNLTFTLEGKSYCYLPKG